MADEVAVTTDSSSDSPCVLMWETSTWMQIRAYKQGMCPKKCLTTLTQNYILAAQANKPVIHVWDVAKEQMHCKIICPGNISALTVSSNGTFCASASSEKIYIWQIATGNLLSILSHHFQTVTCLQFTDDSGHLISGADDNLVLVWPLIRVVAFSNVTHAQDSVSPKHTWSNHSLPITSIHVGLGGTFCRVVTSSMDHTCKLWDLASGHLLRSFVFNVAILSAVMDPAEYRLFVGGFNGKIYTINLFSQSCVRENLDEDRETASFCGHTKQVVSLSLSMDGSLLLSGSKDCTARVWHVASRQCLQVLQHRGCVDNVQILPRSPHLDSQHSKNSLPVLGNFKRSLHSAGETFQAQETERVPVRIFNAILLESHERGSIDDKLLDPVISENCQEDGESGQARLSKAELHEQLEETKQLNQTLCQFAVEELLTNVRGELHTNT